ncbi:MAG: hypothetical protein EBS05_06000 [Proteobacteria bacterium]|nr:hypothetical protein [Pseudomonadota bacterium]
MKINIKAYFDEEKKKQQELVAKAKSEKEKLQKDMALKAESKAQLEKEKKKKEGLLRDSEAEGLDVTKLIDKIRDLDSQIAKADGELELLKKAELQTENVVQRSFRREDEMISVLTNVYKVQEADVIENVEQVFKKLTVEVTKLDASGRPKQCTISVASRHQLELTIKPSDQHFWKNFRPATLRWLPAIDSNESPQEWQKHYNDEQSLHRHAKGSNEEVRVFFASGTAQFILSQKLNWRRGDQNFEDEFADIAIALGVKLKGLVEVERNTLDLGQSYGESPFFAHARSEAVTHTSSKPLFKESAEVLTSVEIYKCIKDDWDAFVNCPWSKQISGVLALLKYHVENGERVRFWSGDFENQYGLRLRTRDHDWIVGQLFIEKSQKAATSKTMMTIHKSQNNEVASLGRLFLCVSRNCSE